LGDTLVALNGTAPLTVDLAPGKSISSLLKTTLPLRSGAQTLSLIYRDGVACHNVPGPLGKPVSVCVPKVSAEATADVAVAVNPARIDRDNDLIPDAVEQELLARFRPYYRFSKYFNTDEDNRPADAGWFVAHSQLQDHHSETDAPLYAEPQLAADPSLLLKATSIGPSAILAHPGGTDYHLNINNNFRSGESDWTRIMSEATGLYGHVAPLRSNAGSEITAYKIEYWQFYAFNPVPGQVECWIVSGPAKGSDAHEGDWEGVELVVGVDKRTIYRVRHNIHSTDVVFELTAQPGPPVGGFAELRGTGVQGSLDLFVNRDSEARHSARVQFFCNADGCTHPVAFIEHGGHASWPTEDWFWPGVLNHDGNSSHQYLVATPVNLGEVSQPNPDCPTCALVVGFNGHWGACGADPPSGPPLKGSWGKP
jgi:hypothetical protein